MTTESVAPPRLDVKALLAALPQLSAKRLEKAFAFAKEQYGEKTLPMMPDVPMLQHAIQSTLFLAEFCRDEDAIIASLLQYTLRFPEGSLDDIGKTFGRSVRDIVSRVHLLSHLYTTDWRKSVDDMKLMLVSVSDDVRVLLITLSVICMLLERVESIHPEYRTRICRQSLQLFAPVAARLGIYALKYRLERYAFPECYPTDADRIAQQLTFTHEESGGFLPRSAHAVLDFLRSEGVHAEVMAREKQPYSIFRKMNSKSVNALEKISDLFAIRVVVPTVEDCYQTLGLLHRMGTPISSRFKDYISFPKPNGYKSLHTCIIGLPKAPRNVMIEIQIRTIEMHREAEYGIVAHWLYKETGKKGKVLESAGKLEFSDMLLMQQSLDTEGKKTKLQTEGPTLVNHIYALTPHGDIIELPEGGTPLDFAFMVHSDLGIKFKSAKVNGRIVPIDTRLENGDVVEILTHKYPQPTLQWLKILGTSSARTKLKAYFFSHNRAEFIAKGKASINRELSERGLPPLDSDLSLLSIVDRRNLSVREREDILVKVGMNALRPTSALRGVPQEKRGKSQKVRATKKVSTQSKTIIQGLVKVIGETMMLPYRFAKCCAPEKVKAQPEIYGIVTRNGRIMVHGSSCGMIKNVTPARRLPMEWIKP